MANELLIRLYDVGLGDCIYVRIPGEDGTNESAFHMLIDCGTWSEESLLVAALKQMEGELPAIPGNGKKRLDLVVVTHEHKDHISGFDPSLFSNIEVGAVWMNCAMNPQHRQAGKARKVRSIAEVAMRRLAALGPSLSPRQSELLSVFQINNAGAMTALRKTLLGGREPTYVHAGQTNDDHGIALHEATIHVLGPEDDIDGFYLGEAAESVLRGMAAAGAGEGKPRRATDPPVARKNASVPSNIGPAAFRALRARMQSNALAFAELDGKVKNNSSVVLLIEWRGRRLLFVGDAEWHGAFKESKMNGSWNVMWRQRRALLDGPVDFLKIGHHGSENSTPWDMGKGKETEASIILDAILPRPADGETARARAVVSTERGKYRTIPRALLMTEIAGRVANATVYAPDLKGFKPKDPVDFDVYERDWLEKPQPTRTDFERLRDRKGFVDIVF